MKLLSLDDIQLELRKCQSCKKEFNFFPFKSRVGGHGIYCSKPCTYLGKRKSTFFKCKNCIKTVYVRPCRKRIFCDRICNLEYRRKHGYGNTQELANAIRRMPEFKEWRKKVLLKNDGHCIKCDKKANHAHHIYFHSFIQRQHNIKSRKDASKCKELWDLNNGAPLCNKCHVLYHREAIHTKKWLKSQTGYSKIMEFQTDHFHGWSGLIHKVIESPFGFDSLNIYTPLNTTHI